MSEITAEWRKRPSCPGMWVCIGKGHMLGNDVVLNLTPGDIEQGAPFFSMGVFGPIPEHDTCDCGATCPKDGTGYCDDCFGG